MSGGSFEISSVVNEGTSLTAIFKTDNVDFVPLGDIASTVELLCVSNPDVNIAFTESDETDTFSFESQKFGIFSAMCRWMRPRSENGYVSI